MISESSALKMARAIFKCTYHIIYYSIIIILVDEAGKGGAATISTAATTSLITYFTHFFVENADEQDCAAFVF